MPILSKLFGGAKSAPDPVDHKGFRIVPDPVSDNGGFRIGARIEKEIDGQTKTHRMIRADTYQSPDTATEASISKAKMLIDQQGEAIFN